MDDHDVMMHPKKQYANAITVVLSLTGDDSETGYLLT